MFQTGKKDIHIIVIYSNPLCLFFLVGGRAKNPCKEGGDRFESSLNWVSIRGFFSWISWWFQPIWKICSSNWTMTPIFRVNIQHILKLPHNYASKILQNQHIHIPQLRKNSRQKMSPQFRDVLGVVLMDKHGSVQGETPSASPKIHKIKNNQPPLKLTARHSTWKWVGPQKENHLPTIK